ncbi:MAG TPA: hypothetical protein VFL31_00055 [Nitrospiraceae bacterium]|nr:hypothetical protein [Nitrospiraceae bacterium]
MGFFASVEGTATIRAQARAFVAAFVRRIETGLLPHAPRWRCQYRVTREGVDGLRFRAADWWTALNVGLNDVELAVAPDGRVHYAIRYRRWASYALALCGVFGVIFITVFLTFDIRDYIVRHPRSSIPGLSTEQNVAIGWVMALFWGFAWPWILIALHKRPLRRLMDQIVAEVDAAAMK